MIRRDHVGEGAQPKAGDHFIGRALGVLLLIAGMGACSSQGAGDNTMNVDENLSIDANAADANSATPAPRNLVHCDVVERQTSREDCDELSAIKATVHQGVAAFNVPSPMTRNRSKTITLVVDRRSPAEISDIESAENTAATIEDMNAVENSSDNIDNGVEVANSIEESTKATSAHKSFKRSKPRPEGAPTPKQIVDPMEGRTEDFKPLVGRQMRADLEGDGFTIKALTEASQEIPEGEQRIWRWEVTPLQAGKRWLVLRTAVEGEVGGKRYQISGTPTTREVEVDVSWGDRIADLFDAAVDWLKRTKVLLLAIAGLIGAAWAVRRAWRGKGNTDDK
jgi:hypothetical protein